MNLTNLKLQKKRASSSSSNFENDVLDSPNEERGTISKDSAEQLHNLTRLQPTKDAAPDARRVPGYMLLKEIGKGGQAIVFLATQLSTGKKVALKIMKDGPFSNDRNLARFKREAEVLASLNHPNIVSIIDTGEASDGSRFISMSYIEGATLDQHMINSQDRVAADPSDILRIFMKICSTMNAAHQKGVVHRDLKPSNIIVDMGNEPHILDFGLARISANWAPQLSHSPVSITGEFLGSLPWCSPEQAKGNSASIDFRTDVYSLGVILYQLITGGRFPYEVAGNIAEVLNNIIYAQPTPPSKLDNPSLAKANNRVLARRPRLINASIEAIVLKALEKNPDDRFQSADEFAKAISNYLAGRPLENGTAQQRTGVSERNPMTKSVPKEWPSTLVVTGLIAAILCGCLYYLFGTSGGVTIVDSQRILGKWRKENAISDGYVIEFFNDGTLRETTITGTVSGTYKILSDRRIHIDQQGMFWGRNDAIVSYRMSGDELLLTPESGSGLVIRCKRLSQQ